MQFKKTLKNEEFEMARIIIYILLVTWYIVLANFIHVQCFGCPLCGMTRAVNSLLKLDFIKAFEYNQNIWIFIILIPTIMIDIINITIHKIKPKIIKDKK